MAMKVLLRRSIEGVGRVGQVVRVRNGYARNFLLPQGMAALVTHDSLLAVEQDKKDEAVREAKLAEARAALAERLADVTLTIEARAGEDGHLFGSVGVRQILDAFLAQGHRFLERQVRFETVRELGEYEGQLVLAADTVLPIKVWVVQDAMEAREMAEQAAQRAAAESARTQAGDDPLRGMEPLPEDF